jgi:hypothetical protein
MSDENCLFCRFAKVDLKDMILDSAFVTAYMMGAQSGVDVGDYEVLAARWLASSCEYHAVIIQMNLESRRKTFAAKNAKSMS